MQYTKLTDTPGETPAQPYRLPEHPGVSEDAHPQDQDFVDYVREMTEAWEAPGANSPQS